MDMTPAQRHLLKLATRQLATADPPAFAQTKYELMLAKLADDKRRLKEIESKETRAEVKKTLLPTYKEWVTGVLENGTGTQDEVLVMNLIWALDAQDFDYALAIADYAIKYGLTLPDDFERPLHTFVVDEFSDAALKVQKNGLSFNLEMLSKVNEITKDNDMPDIVRAKLLKAIGYEEERNGNIEQALTHYRRALELNDRIGLKKIIHELETELASE